MNPRRRFAVPMREGARGFTLPAAIILLVMLAALGAAIVIVSTTQQIGSALDLQGAQAFQAARAGVEWGAYKITRGGASCAASTSFTFPTAPTLAGMTVTVKCIAFADPGGGPTVYEIESTACNQPAGGDCPNTAAPGLTYVERKLKAKL